MNERHEQSYHRCETQVEKKHNKVFLPASLVIKEMQMKSDDISFLAKIRSGTIYSVEENSYPQALFCITGRNVNQGNHL